MAAAVQPPHLVALNLTRRCNLRCAHCYLDAGTRADGGAGRGEKFTGVSPETFEKVMDRITKAAHEEGGMLVRAKCAPHFKRLAMQLDPSWPITLARRRFGDQGPPRIGGERS